MTELTKTYKISEHCSENPINNLHFLLLEKLQGTGNELTRGDLQYLLLFEYNNQQKQQRLRIAVHISGNFEVQNGRVLGLIAIAAIGFFLLPGLIGVSPLMGLLIGAAIGWKVLGFSKKPQQQNLKRESIVSSPGFDTAPQPPQIGGVIPLAFTNKDVNPNGGVRLTGNVLNAYIRTFKNEQTLYTISSLGLGTFDRLSPNELLIDNQPLDNFLSDEITTEYTLGIKNQTRFAEFPFYSQALSPQNNINLGVSFKALANSGSLSGNTFTVSEEDFDAFSPSEKYRINGVDFRVTNKSRTNFRIFCNLALPSLGDRKIYAIYNAIYETTKRCSRIDLNLAFEAYARDNNNNLVNSGILFQLELNGVQIGNFYELNKKEGTIRRSITLTNLPLQKHKIKCYAINLVNTNLPIYRLDDSGSIKTLGTGIIQGGREVILVVESNYTASTAAINAALNTDGKSQQASDRGANCKITSVNEIVFPGDINQGAMTNYPNLVIAKNVAKGSNRLQASPAYSHSIPKAIRGRNHMAAGEASVNSANATLIANGIDLSQALIGHICRNLDRQVESPIIGISGATVTTQSSLNWTAGDRFLIFFEDSINYFPDIFTWTLITKEGGLGNVVSEKFINYPSICAARRFCRENSLFFDGVIDYSIGWDEWVNQESLASLLFPSKYAGNYGLKPETYTTPTDIFNVSRIIPGSFRQAKPDSSLINAVQLTYKADLDGVKYDKTVTVMTADVFFGRETFEPITLNYPSITNEAQAKKVASRTLKSRIIQNKVIKFSTGICGFDLSEGDLIIVQYGLTEKENELSGFCLSALPLVSGNQEIKISKKLAASYTADYKMSVYHLESGNIETDKPFIVLPNGNVIVQNLTEAIKPARENFNADILIICKNISEKIFRTVSVIPKDYQVEVNAINWSQDILNDSDLYYIL
jgi:hypothetical protein